MALVDDQIPVVALSPENTLTEKLVSNLEEVKARGGTLYVFGGGNSKINIEKRVDQMVKNGLFLEVENLINKQKKINDASINQKKTFHWKDLYFL